MWSLLMASRVLRPFVRGKKQNQSQYNQGDNDQVWPDMVAVRRRDGRDKRWQRHFASLVRRMVLGGWGRGGW